MANRLLMRCPDCEGSGRGSCRNHITCRECNGSPPGDWESPCPTCFGSVPPCPNCDSMGMGMADCRLCNGQRNLPTETVLGILEKRVGGVEWSRRNSSGCCVYCGYRLRFGDTMKKRIYHYQCIPEDSYLIGAVVVFGFAGSIVGASIGAVIADVTGNDPLRGGIIGAGILGGIVATLVAVQGLLGDWLGDW